MKLAIIIFSFSIFSVLSCNKASWLDKKPNRSLVIPTTLADFQALMDNESAFRDIMVGEIGTDDFFVEDAIFNSGTDYNRSAYTWSDDLVNQFPPHIFGKCYQAVYYTNIILEGLEKVSRNTENAAEWDRIKGSALLKRTMAFYRLNEAFGQVYTTAGSNKDLGIQLVTSSDLNTITKRSTVKDTYQHMINDLLEAFSLLPERTSFPSRPSKPAASALLARIYLFMENYEKAFEFAEITLQFRSELLDYNDFNPSSTIPFADFATNKEIIYLSGGNSSIFSFNNDFVDTLLYHSYDNNDLRKGLFFRQVRPNRMLFKGSYHASAAKFVGLATDEVYLIRAECYARMGKKNEALEDLNTLMVTRWKKGYFQPFTAPDADAALQLILNERRKQLLFQGIRWSDLRRLNKDPRFAKTLIRKVNGVEYTLLPNHPKYVFPYPFDEIVYSGIEQNPR